MIASFHWKWSGLPVVLTIVGCVCLIKAAVCFLAPAIQLEALSRVRSDRPHDSQIAGSLPIVLVALLAAVMIRSTHQVAARNLSRLKFHGFARPSGVIM